MRFEKMSYLDFVGEERAREKRQRPLRDQAWEKHVEDCEAKGKEPDRVKFVHKPTEKAPVFFYFGENNIMLAHFEDGEVCPGEEEIADMVRSRFNQQAK